MLDNTNFERQKKKIVFMAYLPKQKAWLLHLSEGEGSWARGKF